MEPSNAPPPTTAEATAAETQLTLIQWIVDFLKRQINLQGISLLLLLIFAWYSTGEIKELKGEMKQCYEARYEENLATLTQMMMIINNNTAALQKVGFDQYKAATN
ncbi:MAG TPA: hypothetical protein VFG10_19025 [Saprospiraceae bacterium]|nr:hypothetical protein [Saprospiraceae bacterium]